MTNQLINFYEEGRCNLAPAKWDQTCTRCSIQITPALRFLYFSSLWSEV